MLRLCSIDKVTLETLQADTHETGACDVCCDGSEQRLNRVCKEAQTQSSVSKYKILIKKRRRKKKYIHL